ncbi:hypothetical protein I3760_15G026600 [Carya illinoinensis]|nr:hypothetical protein I3760_15G026600 [Carya illinoinensis]
MGGYNWLLVQVIWVGVILSGMATAALTAAANGSALPNCPNWCGDVEIPYPFGIGEGQIDILMDTVEVCNNGSGLSKKFQFAGLRIASNAFTISNTQNVFIAVGCDTYAYLTGKQNNGYFSMSCMSICQNQSSVLNGTCSGIGCCQVDPGKSEQYHFGST